ncbi:MAG TPA: DUF1269 domain-containing protein [Gaiellaceae bacterium]|nr:DUF1269 domain-containing protein [Gaiellaceae bacterium]
MSDLIAVAYPDKQTAETVRSRLTELVSEHVIEIEDAGDPFMKELGQKLTPGGAALIVLVRKVTADKVLPEIASYGGDVIQTSLDDESEERLREVLQARSAATAGA